VENIAYYNGKISLIEDMMIPMNERSSYFGDGVYEITFTGRILDGWHTYDLHSGFSSTVIAFEPSEGVELVGDPFEKVAAERRFDEIFGEEIGEYEGEIVGELDPKTTSENELGLYMAGAKRAEKGGGTE